MSIDFRAYSEEEIFGNDAAELEEEKIFASYAYERPEVTKVVNKKNRLVVLNAYKGEGKSAILRILRSKVKTNRDRVVVNLIGSDIAPKQDSWDSDIWARDWKKAILGAIASEVGAQVSMAWSDDTTSLVETAEKNGFKSRSSVGYILERIKTKYAEKTAPELKDKRVEAWANQSNTDIWLIIDDVDKNFKNDSPYKAKIAGFFDAVRMLMTNIPYLVIRCSVRPNVWKIVSQDAESLSHLRQYLINITWNEDQIRTLLAKRIEGFLNRHLQPLKLAPHELASVVEQEKRYIAVIFEDPMEWGKRPRPPHIILSTLSRYRPRWLIELCKATYVGCKKGHESIIHLQDILNQLKRFGDNRVDDTVAEFHSQCPQIGELIAAFKGEEKTYNTLQLQELISKKILNHLTPHIAGIQGRPTVNEVAAFLFQIGFLSARRDNPDGSYTHITFVEDPTILSARSNLYDGLNWEIHPVFVNALGMQNRRNVREK